MRSIWFTGFCFFAGAFFTFGVVHSVREAIHARNDIWATADGHLIKCEIGESSNDGSVDEPFARYTYEVSGQEYTGDNLYWPLSKKIAAESAKALVGWVSKQKTLPVHYDTADPERSYIFKNGDRNNAIDILGSACGALIGFYFAYRGRPFSSYEREYRIPAP